MCAVLCVSVVVALQSCVCACVCACLIVSCLPIPASEQDCTTLLLFEGILLWQTFLLRVVHADGV